MFRSVRNAAVDAWRKDEKQGESLLELSQLNGSAHEAGRYQELELRLESLAEDERETIVLKVFDDLTFKEIAMVRGVSINTAASWYRRGIQKLQQMLNENEEES